MERRTLWFAGLCCLVVTACSKTFEPGSQGPQTGAGITSTPVARSAPASAAHATATATASSSVVEGRSEPPFDPSAYPWLADSGLTGPAPEGDLEARFAPPPGYSRVRLAPGSFGAWLRRLPLAAPGTPVRKFSGSVLLAGDSENVAAVVAIDAGKADLQQCADSVIRLHAEWLWSQGRRDMSYRAASGTPMPYERWARGERVVQRGMGIAWVASSRPSVDHGGFRQFLDTVFAWANTVSLDRQAERVELSSLRPGDFVIQPGNPGHAVLFLDVAASADGKRMALLGQGYMPAQGIYVLRPNPGQPWFEIRPEDGAIKTPFWDPFPWSSLRRLDGEGIDSRRAR